MRRDRLKHKILVKYTAIISGLCKRGKLEEAFAVFELIESMGIEADEFVYATLIDGVCRKGQVDRVFGLLEAMERKGICPGVVTYNIVVNGFCKAGRMSEANEVSNGVEGDVVTYSTLLHGYVKEENVLGVVEVKSRFEEAGVSMDNVMCNVLIKALFMMGDVDSAYGLYVSMPDMCLVADAVTYCTMIDGLCKLGKIGEALEVFDEHRRANVLSVACYNCIIAGLCKTNAVDMAMEVFVELNEKGLDLDAGIYKILVKAVFERKGAEGVIKLIYRIENLESEIVNTISNHTINFLCKRGSAEAASEVYAIMRRNGLVTNRKFYSKLLKTLINDGKCYLVKPLLSTFLKEYGLYKGKAFGIIFCYLSQLDINIAIALLDKMKGNGRNVVIPVSALKKLSYSDRVLDAHKLIMEFEDNLPAMNVIDCSIIVDGLCKKGHIREALDLCAFAKKKKIGLNIVSYNTVIYGLCREGLLIEAFRLFDSLERIGLNPSKITYALLIATLCREGYLSDAKKLLEKMVLKGSKPNARIYNSFINGYCKFGRMDEALNLLHDLEKSFLKPDKFTVSWLVNGCCQKGDMENALEFYSEFKNKGVFPDFLGFLYLLRGLCTKGRMEEARSILREMLQSELVVELLGKVNTGVESESLEGFLHVLCEQGSIQEAVTILNEVGYTFFPVHRWFIANNGLGNSKKSDDLEASGAPVTNSVTTTAINDQDPGLYDHKELESIDKDGDNFIKRMQFNDTHSCYSIIASLCSKGELQKANRLAKKVLCKLV